jgi:hypothetical protein
VARIVALDTEVLVIAAGGETPIERGKERALQMLKHHAGKGDSICIPAPAFAECCHGIEDHVLSLLRVVPFDAPAALRANRLIPEIRKAAGRKADRSRQFTRESLKVDAMILATAEMAGAELFYVGEDDWFGKAEEALRDTEHRLRVEIRKLPPFDPQQQALPIGS